MRTATAATLAALLALSASGTAVDAQAPGSIDWDAVRVESMEHFKALLRTDTSNPPGTSSCVKPGSSNSCCAGDSDRLPTFFPP